MHNDIWRADYVGAIAEHPAEAPAGMVAITAAPSPFRQQVTLTLDVRGHDSKLRQFGSCPRVVVSVYDGSGRRVVDLVRDTRPPGRYTAAWDGRDRNGLPAPPGVYLMRATAGGLSAGRSVLKLDYDERA